jgi:uncharacterized protein YndB with AHSA1/START domain
MGTFALQRVVAVPPSRMWEVLTDWAGYARWMPLTMMALDRGPTSVGWSFAGLTGVGRIRFADVMRVTQWVPPIGEGAGVFRLVKVGRLLAGWAEVHVAPVDGGRSTRLRWREDIVLRPAPVGRFLAPLTDRCNRALFAHVIDAIAVEAVRACGGCDCGRNDGGQNAPRR